MDSKEKERTSNLWFRINIGGFSRVLMLEITRFGPVLLVSVI
jgi:hypothetical protein